MRQIAEEKGVAAGQLALAWVLARGEDTVPIPSTKRGTYLEENAAAVDMRLTPEDMERIDEVAPIGAGAGDRHADMSTVHRQTQTGSSQAFRTASGRAGSTR